GVRVSAAGAVGGRGVMAVHPWVAVKATDAPAYTRYEVMGWGVGNGAPAVRVNRTGPDNYWFGSRPELLVDRRGEGVDALVERIESALAPYPSAPPSHPPPAPPRHPFPPHP